MHRHPNLSSQHQGYVDIINTSGEHLLNLINNILEMSKIEAGRTQLTVDRCDLSRLLNDLQALLTLKAHNQGLTLEITQAPEVPTSIYCDTQKLRQVLLNLMGNGLKFTQTGSVTLQVAIDPANGKAVTQAPLLAEVDAIAEPIALTFTVRDTGAGIAEDELGTIFEAFQQTQSGQNLGQGTGLGLPISQQYVQLMGSALKVKSEVGQGSEFSFTLLTQATDSKPSAYYQADQQLLGLAPGQVPPRILIVEDNTTNRLLLKTLLRRAGVEVREAINGEVAVALWRTWAPQLIWMDMRMPKLDGYVATRQIRAEEAREDRTPTVIIALTATAFEEDKKAMLAAGCDDILSKPFQVMKILQKMQHYLGLEFAYESIENQPESSTENVIISANDFVNIPTEWIKKVHLAALECNDQKLLKLIDELPPEQVNIQQALRRLTDQFLFDEVLEVIPN
jgi:two-component system sensor histidine kinase/response regulator